MIRVKDSSFYQVVLEEGIEKGRQDGLEQGERWGRLWEAQKILIRQGRIRFGRLPKATRTAIEAIDDLERLERLSEHLLTATNWADLLSEPN
jgi:predicted transposase YdaD